MRSEGKPPASVLIVDDSPTIIGQLRIILQDLLPTASVLEARDVPAARDLFHAKRPELVFLDIRIPGIDGAQFMSIHEKRQHDAEVVVLTSLPREHPEVLAAIGHGASAYVQKPLRRATVATALTEIGVLAPT